MKQTQLSPPPMWLGALEGRAFFEGLSLVPAWPWLAQARKGSGRVLVAPGYGAGEVTLGPLLGFLNYLGYDASTWGAGANTGQVEKTVFELIDRLRTDESAGPVTLIGWSLGGVVVREAAREAPDLVRGVITLGTPVVGGPKYTSLSRVFAWLENIDIDDLEREVHERNMRGIECPVTSIYSKSDGIVAWRASVDTYNTHAKNVAIPGSHIGLGVNPLAWNIIAETLAENS